MNNHRPSVRRRAFCALEVLLILAVLGIALLPVLNLCRTNVRQAEVSTLSYLAHARVQTLLDVQESLSWSVTGSLNQDAQPLPLPPGAGQPPRELVGPNPAEYRELLGARLLTHNLVMLAAEVSWLPASPGGRRKIRSVRVLARPDASWLVPVSLNLQPIPNGAVTD